MAARNSKGQFVKSGGRKATKSKGTKAIARRAPARMTIRESGPGSIVVATGGGRAPARRRRSGGGGGGRGGGMLGTIGEYFGSPRTDELIASGGWGWVVGNKRATVDELVARAPDFIKPIGGFGVASVALSLVGKFLPGARRVTRPAARVATYLATYNLGRRGAFYQPNATDLLGAGDDDDASGAMDGDEAGAYADD